MEMKSGLVGMLILTSEEVVWVIYRDNGRESGCQE